MHLGGLSSEPANAGNVPIVAPSASSRAGTVIAVSTQRVLFPHISASEWPELPRASAVVRSVVLICMIWEAGYGGL